MIKDGNRYCDVCEEEIPQGNRYRRAHLTAAQQQMVSSVDDPDITFTGETQADGSIRMEICMECAMNMGTGASPISN